jgi:hypothetical protein
MLFRLKRRAGAGLAGVRNSFFGAASVPVVAVRFFGIALFEEPQLLIFLGVKSASLKYHSLQHCLVGKITHNGQNWQLKLMLNFIDHIENHAL